ncbi:hypothetical protein TGCAST_222700 [Toxoplasma gondii CAST]|uniref:Uncharacterized protein n=1 Tax=Toxoplasma gondii CAST TaxID=943122 RepID=A0A425I7M8_TOXGO|nr:hypothetical protein TGCAST_222700 [Toxoplasma gondii CAST]
MVLQVLEAAHELGMVMVVSNAHTRWLRLSLDKLMPRVNHSPQHSNFYNILAFGDQAHDRFAFFTAAENVIRRHQTEACRQMQQQQPSEQLPCFLEPEEIFTPACAAFSPAEVSSLTGRCSAAVANSQVRGFPVNSQHFQGGSPVSNASDMLESRFEVVVDFDSERLQQQVRQLQVLQQRQFPLPLRQQLQPLLPFAEQSSAVSERLLWHFRCPESPLQPHAPETLLLRRLSRSSSDSKSDAVEVERKSDGRDVDSQQAEQQCESPAEPGDTTAHNDTGHSLERRQNVANRSRRRRLRRPGSHNRPGDSNFHYRNPADLRHCMKPSNTVKTRTQAQKMEQGQQTDARQGSCVEAPAEHDNYGNSADSKSVYLKSVRLIAGPSAAELSQQLAVLATSLRRLAESPSFHDLQVQNDSFSQKAVLLPGLLTSQTESTAAASVATAASAMATAAVTAARAAATAAAAVRRVATPVADLSAPVEAVLAASAMAAQAAATAAASAADAFAVTAARGVEAGVETELTPLPPEADFIPLSPEVKEQVRQPEQLTRINHLAKHFAEWRRVATEGREAAKRESEAGSTNTADTMNVAQNAGERVLRVAQQRGNRMEDAARIPVGGPFTLRTSTEELDEFGIMEEKLLRRRNIRRGASRK